MLAGTSEAIGKRLRPDSGAGAAPEFITKRYSGPIGIDGRTRTTRRVSGWARRKIRCCTLVSGWRGFGHVIAVERGEARSAVTLALTAGLRPAAS